MTIYPREPAGPCDHRYGTEDHLCTVLYVEICIANFTVLYGKNYYYIEVFQVFLICIDIKNKTFKDIISYL